ncbi:ATPase WRNIP1 [Sphaeramia orbicularis]|uniref:UBZ4-type domain-containing protein n=1 Tax=Sphaeramia orbicularis TaxID=375764 RepID=A0A672YM53_9TELE|nr:ATPase WRNIP1 [Sphaeramia orbicularis]XP_030016395.1 ATPase WRNIP1 [Sphaeramia orbicularis]
MANELTSAPDSVQCPVCFKDFRTDRINGHLDVCLLGGGTDSSPSTAGENGPPEKKPRINAEKVPSSPGVNKSTVPSSSSSSSAGTSSTAVFSMFQTNKSKVSSQNERNGPFFSKTSSGLAANKGVKRSLPEEAEAGPASRPPEVLKSQPSGFNGPTVNASHQLSLHTLLTMNKPLADILRPNTLEEYFGQTKVVGQQTLLRSLLDSQEIPSLILWGPPGCGKTTLAHIIASASKKNGSARFVPLSATSASVNDVREVIKQAQNELRLCKRKTILFIDEIHRFNKSQQDTFLPHVECGTVTLIGATTENPSFQVNAALLSRCRVLVLERLSVEAMGAILDRAVSTLGVKVLGREPENSKDQDQSDGHEPKVLIEQKALDTIAYLCDGDARVGLNSLQLAVQAQVSLANTLTHDTSSLEIVVKEEHVKEGLQRSHILYDKAGEEHFNCISALHKSMRGSHENASLYWLGRMLEGGEDPLYVARRLVRFASEDVGLADPSALPQAVSTFQACHFIGMPECEVILAQCVVYLARAPKSADMYLAYDNVKACLRNHKGPLPPVPLHLRNASSKLMKQLGYAKGYKYNPAFSGPVEQEYLPEELKGIDFFTWKPPAP